MTTPQIYLVTLPDSAGFAYFLPNIYNTREWYADETQLSRHTSSSSWWLSPIRAERVLVNVLASRPEVVKYVLADPASLSERFPAELTPAQWSARRPQEEDVLDALYRYETRTEPAERVEYPADQVIDLGAGAPVPKDGRTWVAQLPYELSRHTELLHLFPGHMPGFRDALVEELRKLGFDAYNNTTFSVYKDVPYSPARVEFRGNPLRSGRRSRVNGREVAATVKRSIDISPPRSIIGLTRAEAVEKWDAELARWVADLEAWAEPAECGHCNGVGLVPPAKVGAR